MTTKNEINYYNNNDEKGIYKEGNIIKRLLFGWRFNILKHHVKGNTLDIGVGDGYIIPHIRGRFDNYIGMDIAQKRLERATKMFGTKDMTFKVGDATNIPYINEQFDIVIATDVLDHIKKADTAINETYRVLKRKGNLLVSLPTENKLYRLFTKSYYNADDKEQRNYYHYYNAKQITNKLSLKFKKVFEIGLPFIIGGINLNLFMVSKWSKKEK